MPENLFKQRKNMLKNIYTYFYNIYSNVLRPTFFNTYNLPFSRTRVKVFYKLEIGTLKLSPAFQKTEAAFERYFAKVQKQPPRGVSRKSCSENTYQIFRRTPTLKCDFNKVALQLY